MNSQQPIIKLIGVTKKFFSAEIETHALSSINLEIQKGEFVSISGPSGCGKSTLLAILGLLDTPTEGSYHLDGSPVGKLSMNAQAKFRNWKIGYIFQSFNLIGNLSVFDNVELPLIYRQLPQTQRNKQVQEALERVGLSHRLKHYPSQLSGGQQQRVAVARALVGNPSILLADEPTGNLDSKNGESIMELLYELHKEGSTICMVTHDERFSGLSNRVIYLFDGKIIRKTDRSQETIELTTQSVICQNVEKTSQPSL